MAQIDAVDGLAEAQKIMQDEVLNPANSQRVVLLLLLDIARSLRDIKAQGTKTLTLPKK